MASKRKLLNRSLSGEQKLKRVKFVLDQTLFSSSRNEGLVLVAGQNDVGQLGLGCNVIEKKRLALLEFDHKIVDVVAGGMHTVLLSNEGKVFTCGCNDDGALGRPTEDEDAEWSLGEVQIDGKVVQVSAGDSHCAALLEDGRVFAWGSFRDSHGNMVLNSRGKKTEPLQILPSVIIVKITSGENHLALLSINGVVYTCGSGEQGQLGRVSERNSGRNGRNGFNQTHMNKLLMPHPISVKPSLRLHFDNIWCTACGTFAKVADSTNVYVFGLNNYGQLGLPYGLPDENLKFLPVISTVFSKHKWINITGGPHHVVALNEKGVTTVLGRHNYGALGLGETSSDVTSITEVPLLKDQHVTNISTGTSTSFAVTNNGELYSWGMGYSYTLATGDDSDQWEPTVVRGASLQSRRATTVSSGGQHILVLAVDVKTNEVNGNAV